MRPTKLSTLACAAAAAALSLAACGSSGSNSGSSAHPTLTYWASNQGTSLQDDQQVLAPQIAKFTKQTGIKVKVQVIPWTTLLNQITAATVSGKGPDVLNIGNTWSASLQATGAFLPFTSSVMNQIGGSSRFLPGSLSATGAPGKPPTAVPLYSTAYGLYYNKAEFAAAGISGPPATWTEFVADAKKLTKGGHYGLTLEAGQIPENVHLAFELSQQQGGSFFDSAGKPTFDTPQNVAAIKQMIDFMQADKIANPSDAQYSKGTEALTDYATGKAAMVFWQTASGSLAKLGMKASDIGVAPLPLPVPDAGRRQEHHQHGGGHQHRDLQGQQEPVRRREVREVHDQHAGAGEPQPHLRLAALGPGRVQRPGLQHPGRAHLPQHPSHSAAPMPAVAAESQFETAVGTAIIHLYASAATGKTVTDSMIGQALSQAQQQLGG